MEKRPWYTYVILSGINGFKESREQQKDNSRRRRSSTSMSVFNVKQVRQVEFGDVWLTVRTKTSEPDMKKDNVWRVIYDDLDMLEK